jgi:phage recombination protein Bet
MENLALTKQKENELITTEKINQFFDAFGFANSLNKQEKEQFIEISLAYQLNPFKREIYCIPFEGNVKQPDGTWKKERKLSIVVGYETYLKRAERTGKLDGWQVDVLGTGDNEKARITIHRKDWTKPFIHDVYFSEYTQDKKIWKEKPITMLKKVAMAQGFRLAFPDDLGGMPYTPDELPDSTTTPKDNKIDQSPDKETSEVKDADYENHSDNKLSLEDEAAQQQFVTIKDVTTWANKKMNDKNLTSQEKSEVAGIVAFYRSNLAKGA